jgi:type I restriction enzyme R subunit
MTPEANARETIDRKLASAGWLVQDVKEINLGAAIGVVVREFPTDSGPADYVLFIDRARAAGALPARLKATA